MNARVRAGPSTEHRAGRPDRPVLVQVIKEFPIANARAIGCVGAWARRSGKVNVAEAFAYVHTYAPNCSGARPLHLPAGENVCNASRAAPIYA